MEPNLRHWRMASAAAQHAAGRARGAVCDRRRPRAPL